MMFTKPRDQCPYHVPYIFRKYHYKGQRIEEGTKLTGTHL